MSTAYQAHAPFQRHTSNMSSEFNIMCLSKTTSLCREDGETGSYLHKQTNKQTIDGMGWDGMGWVKTWPSS